MHQGEGAGVKCGFGNLFSLLRRPPCHDLHPKPTSTLTPPTPPINPREHPPATNWHPHPPADQYVVPSKMRTPRRTAAAAKPSRYIRG